MNEEKTPKGSKKLPPNYGWWLARSSHAKHDLDAPEDFRPLSKEKFDTLTASYIYISNPWFKPKVEQLFKAYEKWCSLLKSAPSVAQTGSFPKEHAEEVLANFLSMWRKALNNLATYITSRFKEEPNQLQTYEQAYKKSKNTAYDKYIGYRVVEAMRNIDVHQETPPIELTFERHPYVCKKCGKIHEDVGDLSVTISRAWLRDNCSKGILKQELDKLNSDSIDIGAMVEQSMQGFMDILYNLLLLTSEGKTHCSKIRKVFDETCPDYPVLVKFWSNERGEPLVAARVLDDVNWVVKRTSVRPP